MNENKAVKNLKHLLSGSALSIVSLFVVVGIGFFMQPFMIRTLGDVHYAIWALAGTFTGWYAILDFGLNHAVSRFFTKSYSTDDETHCNIYASTGFYLYLGLGAIAFLCSLVLAVAAFQFYTEGTDGVQLGEGDKTLLAIMIIMTGFSFAWEFPFRALYGVVLGSMRHDLAGVASIGFRLFGALQTFVILSLGGGLIALGFASIVIMLLQVYVYYRLAKRSYRPLEISPKNFRKDHAKSLFGYSFYAFMAQIGDIIIYSVDTVVVSILVSMAAVTHYNIALTLTNHFKGLLMSSSSWMVSWLTYLDAQKDRAKTLYSMFFGYRFGTYFAGFIAFGLIMWGEPFITRWMGPDYVDAVPCLVALVIAATIQAIQEPNIRYMYATSNHHYFALCNILEGLLNLVLSLILVMSHGMLGVALGTLISCALIRGFVHPLFVCRLLGINYFVYYLRIGWYLLMVAAALLVPYTITTALVGPTYRQLFTVGILSALSYFPIIYYIGFSTRDRQMIHGFLFRKKRNLKN